MKKNDFKFKKLEYAEIDKYSLKRFAITATIIKILIILAAIGFIYFSNIHGAAKAPVDSPKVENVDNHFNQVDKIAKTGTASWYDFSLCKQPSGTFIGRVEGCAINEEMIYKSYGIRKKFCAARDFERYSWVKVTNTVNGKSTECQILDFGPDPDIHPDRIIDLSPIAFSDIGLLKIGLIHVKVELIDNK